MDVGFRRIARGQTMTDKIKISNLYKVFGKNPAGAMDHVRKGTSKPVSYTHLTLPTTPYV